MIQKPKDFIRERKVYEYDITLPQCPKKEDIANWNLPQKKQKFIRTEMPFDLYQWNVKDRRKFINQE